ncbi:MAG: LysR family transcriptional regulator, partial [Oxalobacteraceae bacterium]
MRRGDLDDLAAFAAVAGTRSFTRAAAQLGLSPSALSHALKALETRLGVRLLARTTRSVSPTRAGEQLLRSLDPALAQVAQGLAALADWRDAPSGTVRLTTFGYAARTILAPRLPRFLLDHPDVSVEVIVEDRLTDLVAGGFDAGIRLGETVERDMVAVQVGPDLRTVVVGTPGYFAQRDRPETPGDLQRHVCINYRLLGGGGLLPWE